MSYKVVKLYTSKTSVIKIIGEGAMKKIIISVNEQCVTRVSEKIAPVENVNDSSVMHITILILTIAKIHINIGSGNF